MGGNKKNGKKKKKDQEEKDVLTEVEKEFYEIQLTDLNRKLSRLRTRNGELESLNVRLEESVKKLDEDRSDVIAYLKKILATKTNELIELQERFDGLKQSMESGVVRYKERISQMEQEYRNTQEELTSDIKLLMGKLNSLEEFRAQKEELTARFAAQEEKMANQEKVHQENLYRYEKNFVLEKNKLKKQMETRLLQMSLQFQQATDVRIAATTQRIIRENIAINNELTTMQEAHREITADRDGMKEELRRARTAAKLFREERDRALQTNREQLKVIDELISRQRDAEIQIKELDAVAEERDHAKRTLEGTREKLKDARDQIEKLTDRLAAGQSNAAKLYADIAALKLNSRRLYGTLHRAVNAVKEALRIHEEPDHAEEVVLSKRLDLLNNLLQILNRAETSEKERYPTRKISLCYKRGDLGFVPTSAADPTSRGGNGAGKARTTGSKLSSPCGPPVGLATDAIAGGVTQRTAPRE